MCRSVCPTLAVTGNERHQPWGRATLLRHALVTGADPPGKGLVDSAYACATCAACTVPCQVDGVETPHLVWALRAALATAGATPEVGRTAVAVAQQGRVPSGPPPGHVVDPAPVLEECARLATPGADLLLVAGCGALGRRPSAVLAAARALVALDVSFRVPDRHRCCGMVARTFGDPVAASDLARALLEPARAAGIRRMVVQSPSCTYHLAAVAPDVAPGIEILPLATVLAQALEEHPRRPSAGRIAYHDPCYLGRHLGVRREPRVALRLAGYDVVELAHRGDGARCSGQGGGLPLTYPDIARGYADLLAEDCASAGVATVATGCASTAAALAGRSDLPVVVDIAEAVAGALGSAPGGGS